MESLAFILYAVLAVFIAGVPYVTYQIFAAQRLRRSFIGLGNLIGLEFERIRNVVGDPGEITQIDDGMTALWRSGNYSICLSFNGNVCDGILYEHTAEVA